MKNFIVSLVALAMLAGCASPRVKYGIDSFDSLQKNVTTQQDLLKRFGFPTIVESRGNGTIVWKWQDTPNSTVGSVGVQLLAIALDQDGYFDRILQVVKN
jgi:hypothetical protein